LTAQTSSSLGIETSLHCMMMHCYTLAWRRSLGIETSLHCMMMKFVQSKTVNYSH